MPALGTAVTVTIVDAVSFAQPPVPVTIYLIVDVPADTPDTTPLPFIVATPVDNELHEPPVPLVDNVVVPFEQISVVPLMLPAFGDAVMVTVLVAVASLQPPVPVTVYVIVDEPVVTTVIAPVEPSIVATASVPLVHAPPATVDVNVVEPVTHIACVPLNVPALGAAVTVTTVEAVSFAQPPVPVTIYLIVDVPADTPDTTPLPFIVATPVDTELHVPSVPVVDKVVVPFEQTSVVPLMLPAFGADVTVIVLVAVSFAQAPEPVTIYLIIDVPADTGVTSPLPFIVATPVDTELHEPPVPVVDKVVVPFEQIDVVPLMLPAFGAVVMVKFKFAIESQPKLLVVLKEYVPDAVYVVPFHK